MMNMEGTPDSSTYADIIRSVTLSKSLSEAHRIHEEILRSGILHGHNNLFIANLLIRMYAHCGDLSISVSIFSEVFIKDVFTWNIMISSFLLHGESRQAISHFNQMMIQGIIPDKCSFVSVLSACVNEETLGEGKQIHNQAFSLGFNEDLRVGTSLLEMYRRCGDIDQVLFSFSRMLDKDVFSWSAVISACANYEKCQDSMSYFQQMIQESILPDEVIFSSVLSSCDGSEFLPSGKRIHACIVGNNYDLDIVLGTSLINMYSRCGNIHNAYSMFKKLPKRDTISWNAMTAMFVKHGLHKDALKLYKKMMQEKVSPDRATFVSLLEACSMQDLLNGGMKLHRDIMFIGFDSDILVNTSLMNMYSRCNNLKHAWKVFETIAIHDIVSWNAMIDVCAQHDQSEDALQLFGEMQKNGVVPNKVTLLNMLQACTNEIGFSQGTHIHNDIVARSLELDLVVATALVTMYGKCNSLEDAWELFTRIPERNLVSWNAMLASYAQYGTVEQTFALFEQMILEGDLPNKVTFLSMLSLHQSKPCVPLVGRLHSFLLSIGLDKDVSIGNALICMHGKCGNLKAARLVFDTLSERDVVSWTAMMSVYCQEGLHKDCHLLFEQMQRQGIIVDKMAFVIMITAFSNASTLHEGKMIHSHVVQSNLDSIIDVSNALVNMYGKCGSLDDAFQTFDEMQTKSKQTYINILSTCANLVALSYGKQIHHEMMQKGFSLNGLLGNNLINMYGKCGCILDAQRVFDKMQDKDVISWSTMITTYAQNGQGKKALELFDCMKHDKVWPNEVTFLGVLSACNHTGLIDDCYHHFMSMTEDYGISPLEDHYTCVIDLLSRSGRLDEAENTILKMPSESRSIPWMALLGACLFQVDVARAERAANEIFSLEPKNPTPYVMLANVYASAGREDDATKVLSKMKQKGLYHV